MYSAFCQHCLVLFKVIIVTANLTDVLNRARRIQDLCPRVAQSRTCPPLAGLATCPALVSLSLWLGTHSITQRGKSDHRQWIWAAQRSNEWQYGHLQVLAPSFCRLSPRPGQVAEAANLLQSQGHTAANLLHAAMRWSCKPIASFKVKRSKGCKPIANLRELQTYCALQERVANLLQPLLRAVGRRGACWSCAHRSSLAST